MEMQKAIPLTIALKIYRYTFNQRITGLCELQSITQKEDTDIPWS